jgi:hypothetical protein
MMILEIAYLPSKLQDLSLGLAAYGMDGQAIRMFGSQTPNSTLILSIKNIFL